MTTSFALGPEVLGLRLGTDATVSDDGWLVRSLLAPDGLDGPAGILQGGFASGVAIHIARAADRFGAPLTAVQVRLHAPTPLGRPVQARVRATDTAATYEVETRDGDRLLASATVELAGHEPTAHAYDLLELASVPLPQPRPQHAYPSCWVCGPEPTHPYGQRLHPAYHGADLVVPFVADEELGDDRGVLDPLIIAAILDCPTAWAAMPVVEARGDVGALLGGYRLQVFRDAPVMEPLRTVARLDGVDGRKLHARAALVDEDGIVYAVASALQISVAVLPGGPA